MSEGSADERSGTKSWKIRLYLFEENDVTVARAVLETGDNTLESRGESHRSSHDPQVPEVGDEFAAGRALVGLGHQLLRAGTADSEALEHQGLHGARHH